VRKQGSLTAGDARGEPSDPGPGRLHSVRAAILAITADPLLVFTSNVFAILGLRSLYFAPADMIDRSAS
jgi:hypothetical protein